LTGWIKGAAIAALVAAATVWSGSPVGAQELTKQDVEATVRELLQREPELVLEALQEVQRKREAEAAALQRDAVAGNAELLFEDPMAPIGGNPDGDVTLVEFFDYQCGFCRRMVPTLRALLADDDQVRLVFKELPILGPESVEATKAALASVRQDRYLDFHFALMASQDLTPDGIRAAAESVGLDVEQLFADMADPAITMQINANYALARTLGIEGTPAMVIGEEFVPGAVEDARLRELIATERARCETATC
jgi:protein-disulfide isomerase